jgi:hypothetical protein
MSTSRRKPTMPDRDEHRTEQLLRALEDARLLRESLPANGILRCEECGCIDDGQERGWTLHIGDDDGLYTFCPDCDGREFG